MTSECQHEAWEFCPPQSRRCADCGEWLEDQPLETAMTSELRPAVEVWDDAIAAWAADTIDTRQAAAAVIEADREAVRAEQAAEVERLNRIINAQIISAQADYNVLEETHFELAKFKALAETLADALRKIDRMNNHPEWFRTELNVVLLQALRKWEEARDAS